MERGTIILLFTLFFSVVSHSSAEAHNISAIFAFGDSAIDPGNNNYIGTWFRADHSPYGHDFPSQVATGRFSNGKLMTDFLVSSLGIKDLLPAYLDPSITDHDLFTGVSFASAGSGFDDSTTVMVGGVSTMAKQVEYFEECLYRIANLVGKEAANRVVKDALFVISAGTNDLLGNFYDLPLKRLTTKITMSAYQDFLLDRLHSLIQILYSLGARKIVVAGLPPIGCLPLQMTGNILLPGSHMRVCVQQQNEDAVVYNSKLQTLLASIQASRPGTTIAYLDAYDALLNMIIIPEEYGLVESWRGCCGSGVLLEMGPKCNESTPICSDPSKFVFWDSIHPSQAANQQLAKLVLSSLLPLLNS
ncbi:hypothetical protein AAC387_Pa10g0235 [Persea americana]